MIIDKKGRVIDANQEYVRLTGYRELREILGRSVIEWTADSEKQKNAEAVRQCAKDGFIKDLVIDYVDMNGQVTPVEINAAVIGAGEATRIVSLCRDITERKKIEDALVDGERRYRGLYNAVADGVIVIDCSGAISEVNEFACKIFGYSREEIKNSLIKPIWHAINEDGSPFPMENHPAMVTLKTGKSVRDVVMGVYLPNRGEYLWLVVNSAPMFNSKKGVESALITFVDITELKHAEQALLESEEKFQKMIDQSPVVFEIYDKNGLQVRVNPAWDKLWQIPRELSVGKWNILKSEQTEKTGWLPYVKKAYAGETVFLPEKEFDASLEPEALGKSRKRWLSTIMYPIKNSHGEVTQIVLMHEDMTEKKILEKQVQDNERFAAIGQTAGMVGHDIRNPLQAIISELYIAKGVMQQAPEGKDKEEALDSVNFVEEQVNYINKIVSDLQDYARPLKPEFTVVNLTDLIVSIFDTIVLPDKIKLDVDVKDNLKFKTDPTFVKRSITNLVNNAVQAMPDGGELGLTAQKKDECIVICVSDTGQGIPEHVKANLFKALTTTKSKGQGLGLAVVKRLIEALNGNVSFESVAGKGTKFIIELPTS